MSDKTREFEAWWESDGKYCRAGGGDYERTFAYEAWQAVSATLAQQSTPTAPASDRLEKLLAEEERSHDLTMRQRDRAEEIATELAEAIGEYFGCDVGEHSSGNCPWENALGVLHTAKTTAPAAPVTQEPVIAGTITIETDDQEDMQHFEFCAATHPIDLPDGEHRVYFAPPAAEQPDAVKVPRKVLENWLDSADERERPRFVHVLRALLAGGAE